MENYLDALAGYARRKLRPPIRHLAIDLVHDAWLVLESRNPDLPPIDDSYSYLLSVIKHLVYKENEALARRVTLAIGDPRWEIRPEPATGVLDLDDVPLDVLTDRQVEVLRLLVGGMTQADVAEQLGTSQQSVHRMLKRIRKAVQNG